MVSLAVWTPPRALHLAKPIGHTSHGRSMAHPSRVWLIGLPLPHASAAFIDDASRRGRINCTSACSSETGRSVYFISNKPP